MAGADHFAFDAELAAQADVQAVGEHHQPRGNGFTIGQGGVCRSALVRHP